jgi:gamma-glutamyltranspeptidase/glutathione hydrolase
MKRLLPVLFALALAACATATPPAPAGKAMVVAADKRAAEAGMEMIRKGGTATDAAIATMAVLGLVEPQSAGIGGGGFLLTYQPSTKRVTAYDGREAAPAAATAQFFFGADGKPLPFPQAVASGRSTGAPSLYAMLKLAHDRSGRLPWASLFEPAIKLAEDGFIVSPRMSEMIAGMADRSALKEDPAARAYLFTADGKPLPAGTLLKNPQYAATLRALAAEGPKALQDGPIADAIIAATRQNPRPGVLTKQDLKNVKPRALSAVCAPFRVYKVCGMPPPSSGGTTVLDILGLYQRARPAPAGPNDANDWAAFIWASRVAFADRDYYLADDTFVPVPVKGLVSSAYLDRRAKAIDLSTPPPAFIAPGDPAEVAGGKSLIGKWGLATPPEGGTTHMSIVDRDGDVAAMTASIEAPFGAQRMAAGFFLNNQLTDFSLNPVLNGKPVANAVAAGKKPRSSMAPTIVFDADGKFYAAIGSPGGSSIIDYVAKTLIGVLDWRLPMQDAIDLPNVVAAGPQTRAESDRFPPAVAAALRARGWTIAASAGEISGLNGILMTPDGPTGGSDPRREGVAIADTQ